mmetsp:Transcript_1481/g.3194  ORF Transcript_1481/g.3194 Transcript_1481/m.3194 type:complete len:87 (+) Transcript_1481:1056-1316(+)
MRRAEGGARYVLGTCEVYQQGSLSSAPFVPETLAWAGDSGRSLTKDKGLVCQELLRPTGETTALIFTSCYVPETHELRLSSQASSW